MKPVFSSSNLCFKTSMCATESLKIAWHSPSNKPINVENKSWNWLLALFSNLSHSGARELVGFSLPCASLVLEVFLMSFRFAGKRRRLVFTIPPYFINLQHMETLWPAPRPKPSPNCRLIGWFMKKWQGLFLQLTSILFLTFPFAVQILTFLKSLSSKSYKSYM